MSENNFIDENLLERALEITKSQFYLVKIYETNGIIYVDKKMSYFELGSYLTTHTDSIDNIKIFIK